MLIGGAGISRADISTDWRKSGSFVEGEPQGNWRRNSNSRDVVASSTSFSRPGLWRACSQATISFFFFSYTKIQTFRTQLQKNSPTFCQIERDKTRAMKFEWALMHFLSEVFVADAVVIAQAPYFARVDATPFLRNRTCYSTNYLKCVS